MSKVDNAKVIEKDMRVTRAKIDQTVDEIGHRLTPTAIKEVAKQGLVQTRHYVEREAAQKIRSTTEHVTRAGRSGREMIRSYPLAVALVGLGLGLLLSRHHSNKPTTIEGDLK